MRWIFRTLFGLLTLVIVAVVVLLLLPSERIASVVTARFEAATGRSMTINGDIRPSVWPTLGVRIDDVSIANAEWAAEGPLVSTQSLSVGVDLSALLSGQVKVKEVTLQSPRIRLEKAVNGQVNWDLAKPGEGSSSAAASGVPEFTLDQASIRDAEISYFDRAQGTVMVLSEADIDLSVPDFNGPLDLAITGRLNGEPLDTDITFASLSELLSGRGRASEGSIAIGASNARFGGSFATAPFGADMSVNATLTDIAQLFRAIGQTPPAIPAGLGDRILVMGNLSYADGNKIFLRDATLELAGNALTGEASVTLADKPFVRARFQGGDLDFARFVQGGSGEETTVASGWSKDPIDVSGLAAVDADISLGARSINLGVFQLGATQLSTSLTNRRLVFDIDQLSAYGGSAAGQYVINGRGGLSTGGRLAIRGVQIQPLLRDFAGYERLLGQTDIDLKFLAVGNSMHALMQRLSGSGSVQVGEGELLGLDIAGMIRNLDPSFVGAGQKTIFNEISASFVINDGVLQNEDLALIAPLMRATGRGAVDIGKRTLNYRVTPTALPGADGSGGIKVPLKITGSWDDPKFGLDMQAIIDQELADEKAALKARAEEERLAAEARAKAKVEEKLGVTREEGESIEDAAKRKLEEEAKKGLLKLLGGN